MNIASEPIGLSRFCWVSSILLLALMCFFQVLNFLEFADMDFRIYYDASIALRSGKDIFAAWNPDSPLTYIYPPLLAILFIPLTFLPLEVAAALWTVISMSLLFACLWVGAREVMARFDGRIDVATLPVIILIATLLSLPRIKSEIDQGQVDYLILFGIIGSLALLRRHPFLAGVVLGLVANIKYQTIIFIPLIVVRGWWSTLLGFLLGSIGVALSGAFVIGWDLNLDYLRDSLSSIVLLFGGEVPADEGPLVYPLEWVESVSLSSTCARWANSVGWEVRGAYLMIGLSSLICFVIGWSIYLCHGLSLFRGRWGASGRTSARFQGLIALEWTGLLVAVLAFAPQTKMRHMAILVLLMILVAQFLVVKRDPVPRWPILLAAVVFMMSMVLPLETVSEGFVMGARETWRANGGVVFPLLLLLFVALWTGCAWTRHSVDRSDAEAR
ncbi:MAG: hypothetical protein CMJ33_00185 [Phycisphaerae bacterium]|nr:hypothetical protein [Phycisphaerae bacterium]HAW96449.1 hypothetical protein [Phycisphaerales bacterium]